MALRLKALQAASSPEQEQTWVAGCEFWKPRVDAVVREGEIVGLAWVVRLPSGRQAERVWMFEEHAGSLVERLAKRFGRFLSGGRD